MTKRPLILTTVLTVLALPLVAAEPTANGYARIGGIKIYYEIHGIQREGETPLLLLHGGGSTLNTSFGSAIDDFAKTRRVIAFDQQGHGRTADRKKPFSFKRSADDAAALLKFLKVKQADVLGYSNGGQIAIEMALRHPKSVRRMVIASAMVNRAGAVDGFWAGFDTATIDTMPADLKEEYSRTSPHPQKLRSFFEKSVARMKNFKGWTDDQVRSIDHPALVLIGDRDIVKPEHALELSRLLPHGRLAIVPADHMALVGNWPVAVIARFLDGGKRP